MGITTPFRAVSTGRGGRSFGRGPATRVLRAALRTRRGMIGAGLAVFVLLVAFVGPAFTPWSATKFVAPPFSHGGVGQATLLGSDTLGRDVLSRTLDGGRSIIVLSLLATIITIGGGALAGIVSAYRRGLIEGLTMRAVDVVLAIPQLVFVLLLLSVIGPKQWLLVMAVGLAQAPQTARIVHAAAQNVCERDFVKAAALWGVPPRTVIRRNVVPNLLTPLLVEAGLRLSNSIILIAGLNFLGLGTQPPAANWGVMVNENRLGLGLNAWGVVAPAVLLALLSVGTNTLADAISRANLGEDRGEEAVVNAALAQAPGES